VWWIALSVIILALLVFVGAVVSLVGRLHPLERALRRLRIRGEDAEKLQAKLLGLQQRTLALQASAEAASTWASERKVHDREVPLRRVDT